MTQNYCKNLLKSSAKFSFIDLFAGIGGFRLAMQNLGGQCVFSSEIDKHAAEVYQLNFREKPFGDITQEATKKHIPVKFDLLCGGFPCQPFSIAGKQKGLAETRGTLFYEIADILYHHQPHAFLLENVKHLIHHEKGNTIKLILEILRNELNYFVPTPQVLNSKDFGLPQSRRRVFIVGFHKNLNIRSFNYPSGQKTQVCFRAIKEQSVPPIKYFITKKQLEVFQRHKNRHLNYPGYWFRIIPDFGIIPTLTAMVVDLRHKLIVDKRIYESNLPKEELEKLSPYPIRYLTPRECARLQGFPDNFIIHKKDYYAYKQFGNSISVPVVQAIGNKIIDTLLAVGALKNNDNLICN